MLSAGVKRLSFLDGSVQDLSPTGVTVIVGPNNAGKSVLLAEIAQSLERGEPFPPHKWISGVEIHRSGDAEALEAWFRPQARLAPEGSPYAGQHLIGDQMSGNLLTLETCTQLWFNFPGLGPMTRLLVGYYDAMSRATLLQPTAARNPMVAAIEPLHRVWDDRGLESRLSQLVRRAFGFEICINRYAQQIELLMGKPGLPDEVLPASAALLDEYARLRAVSTQGDGIRSFLGLLLVFLASGRPITLIDEPEAFLHPPQARLLGRYLAQQSSHSAGQVLLATHSDDILEGILDGAGEREVKIVRVSNPRSSGMRKISTLPADRVKSLWTDPLLRYSRMLDGLFHQGVVVCEADGDCRFYEATLDARLAERAEHDLVFTHVGGKGRLAQALAELNRLALHTAVVGDLDVLSDIRQVSGLVTAGGGDPTCIVDDLRLLHSQIDERLAAPTVRGLRNVTKDVLSRRDASAVTDTEAEAIASAVKFRSGWSGVKRSGTAAFEGDASAAVGRVLDYLRGLGIFLVPVGELERWFPEVNAGHGVSHVTAVLEGRKHEHLPPELCSFLDQICAYFGIDAPNTP